MDRRFDQLVEVRRHLHAHPELSGEERETSLYLYQLLGELGFDVRMGPEGRGVLADGPHDGQRPLVALRADIDALRIHDAKHVAYRSQRDGVMHACGHDAHTAVVFGALASLMELEQRGGLPWAVPLRGVFQPAEEISRGAREMIQVGALEQVGSILAVHVDPSRSVGRIGLRSGVLTASCDEMRVRLEGRGGHAARPHETSDPIAAAAQLISSLYQFIPRATDSQEAVVVTIGRIQGGDNANVIPEQVELQGTLRTLDSLVRQQTIDHIRRLAAGIGQVSQTQIEVEFGASCRSVRNDPRLTRLLEAAAAQVVGADNLERIARPSMGSEDFAYYLDHTPGAMIRLGCASSQAGGSPLHTPEFDVDERALAIGAKVLARAAVMAAAPAKS